MTGRSFIVSTPRRPVPARALVGDGQRVTAAAVAEPALALKVRASQIVGSKQARQMRATSAR